MVALNKELFPRFQEAKKVPLTKFVPDPDNVFALYMKNYSIKSLFLT